MNGQWCRLGLILATAALCASQPLQASKRDAIDVAADGAIPGDGIGISKPATLALDSSDTAIDFDSGVSSDAAGAGITFGRALDLQGSPIRLSSQPQPGSRSRFDPVRSNLPSSLPSGMPVRSRFISSSFGSRWHPIYGGYRMHAGIDIVAAQGTPVFATSTGLVIVAGECGGYGLCIAIDHGGGVVSIYGHLSRIEVRAGTSVSTRQEIGLVGSTGTSTGPHLHYEIRIRDHPVNPVRYLAR